MATDNDIKEREDDFDSEGSGTEAQDTAADQAEVRDSKDGGAEVDVHHESRRERRARQSQERMQEQIDGALKPLRNQNAELALQLRQLGQFLQQQQIRAPETQRQEKSDDDIDPDILALKREQKDIIARIKTAGPEDLDKLERKWHALEQKSIDIRAKKIVSEQLASYKPPAQMDYHEQQLRYEFQDVFSDPGAQEYAWSIFTQAKTLATRRGEQFNVPEAHRKALNDAAVAFGLRKAPAPAPSNAQRQRFAAPGGGAGNGNKPSSTTRTITPVEKRFALASDDRDIPDSQKISDWVKRMEANGYFDDK